jgi:hypothetical protein
LPITQVWEKRLSFITGAKGTAERKVFAQLFEDANRCQKIRKVGDAGRLRKSNAKRHRNRLQQQQAAPKGITKNFVCIFGCRRGYRLVFAVGKLRSHYPSDRRISEWKDGGVIRHFGRKCSFFLHGRRGV